MADSPQETFIKFHYPEVKDLAKHFLTLIAGTLVLTVTFADKILPRGTASPVQKILLGSCWLLLLGSFVLAGAGIFVNYIAAEQARGGVVYDYKKSFIKLARSAYLLLDMGALLFAAALFVLAFTGGLSLMAG